MKIHQLSVNYQAEQDRIFVRINTSAAEEVRLWLTRRLMVGLWPLLTRLLTQHLLKLEAAGSTLESADDGLKKMLADFRKEQFLQEADFDTPYDENQAVLPLGPKPVLVTDVDASPLPNGRLRLVFNERLPRKKEPRNFQVEMDPKLMQGLIHLLEQALTRSQWLEPFTPPAAVEEAAEEGDGKRKPRYLQ
ncbi:hypothetical protein [Ramlibacter sp. PS4R-6]|uniref:hypothetical protein n=1 Tax=Ramlibacter sp. PS4R-6 TaxID=3133438 RepID=UPI0030A0B2BB